MFDVSLCIGVVACIAFIVFFMMGIPCLMGMLLRVLFKRWPAGLVAFLAAGLVFAAGLPQNMASNNNLFDVSRYIRLLEFYPSRTSVVAIHVMEFSIWLLIGIGMPFIFAMWGAELTDRIRKRSTQTVNTSSEPVSGATSSASQG